MKVVMTTDLQLLVPQTMTTGSRSCKTDSGSPRSHLQLPVVGNITPPVDSVQPTLNRSQSPWQPGVDDIKCQTTPRSRPVTPARSRKKARKANKPQKSALCWDPNFRGATLWFNTQVEGDETQLRITSFFSKSTGKRKSYSVNKCRRHRNESVSECKSSSESEDSRETYPTMNFTAKTCASCGARRTPLWRDAEDGTPLCNACGIRYRKYRVRCSKCWHIPKKDSKTYPACSVCGGLLRFSQNRKLW